jgi:hypothetical protein
LHPSHHRYAVAVRRSYTLEFVDLSRTRTRPVTSWPTARFVQTAVLSPKAYPHIARARISR